MDDFEPTPKYEESAGDTYSVRVHTPDAPGTELLRGHAADLNLLAAYLQRYDRAQTRRAYRNDLAQFFGTDYVDQDLAARVTFLHINQHIADLQASGQKNSTIKRRIAALRGFFAWLVALDLLPRNPADKHLIRRVRSARYQDRPITVLSADQAQALITAASESGRRSALRDQTLILTLLHCVLRRSEASAMNVEDLRPLGPYWVLDLPETKGGADQFVKVPDAVVEAIQSYLAGEGIASGPMWRSYSNNSRGKRLSPTSIYRIVNATAKKAGLLERVGAHTLRHTGCTLAIEAGASIHQVQSHARHKKIETTMVYIHQRDRLRNSAADYISVGTSLSSKQERQANDANDADGVSERASETDR